MSKVIGFSVYVTAFEKQRHLLEKLKGYNFPIFTSLHISEEVTDTYVTDVQEMCDWLHENGFYIIADVSPYTLERFDEPTLLSLVKRLHIDNIRLDFGFDNQSLVDDLNEVDITYNASTILGETDHRANATYMHNFYPRPETGLDGDFLTELNKSIRKVGGKTLAFISGDKAKRGPIFDGLPTLEKHRYLPPYVQFIDLVKRYEMDAVYIGDVLISDQQLALILSYLDDGLIRLPVKLDEDNNDLFNKPFTVRVDSPRGLVRVQESREFAQEGERVKPFNTTERVRGSITMDNEKYKRYSGEVQVLREDYKADKRVNVIGEVSKEYITLLDNLKNGEQFMFVKCE